MSGLGSDPRRRMFGPAGWGARDASDPALRAVGVGGLALYALLIAGATAGAWLGWSQTGLPGAVVGLMLGALFTPLALGAALFLGLLFQQLGGRIAATMGLRPDRHPIPFAVVRWTVFLILANATCGIAFLLYHLTPSWMLWMGLGGMACVAVAVFGPLALFLAFVRMRMVQISTAGRTWSAAGDPSPFGGPAGGRRSEGLVLEADASPSRPRDDSAEHPPTQPPPSEPPADRS